MTGQVVVDRRQHSVLLAVVILEVITDLGGLLWAMLVGPHVAVPGGIVRLVAMTLLGGASLLGKRWAQWVFALLLALTAMAGTFFGLVSLRGGAHFSVSPVGLVIGALYGVAAVGAWPTGQAVASRRTSG